MEQIILDTNNYKPAMTSDPLYEDGIPDMLKRAADGTFLLPDGGESEDVCTPEDPFEVGAPGTEDLPN
jgi:hypothetical protein